LDSVAKDVALYMIMPFGHGVCEISSAETACAVLERCADTIKLVSLQLGYGSTSTPVYRLDNSLCINVRYTKLVVCADQS